MITEKLEGIASGFKNKFGRAADYVNNPRNATKQMAQRKQPPAKALNVKKPKNGKVGSVDTAFYTKVSAGQNSKLRQGDSIADISAKLLSFIKKNEEDKKLHFELMRDFDKENIQEDERRHKELMEAFKKPKKKEKEEKKEVKKKAEDPTKETKKVDKAATEVKKETQAVPEKKVPEAAKPVEVPKKVEAPTAKPAAEAKPSVTAKPVEPAPPATQATTPTVTIPKPSVSTGISTATKIGAGAAIVGLAMPALTYAHAIDDASKTVGVDRALMYAIAKQESNFDPQAKAGTSSAKGLYQFISSTWNDMVKKYGKSYPILKERGPEDANASAIAGALFIKENSEILSKAKVPVNATSVYAAHFLGAGGAKTLFTADPNKSAAEILPQAAASNAFIFYEKTGKSIDKSKPRTVKQVIQVLFEKVGQYQEKYAQVLEQQDRGSQLAQSSVQNKELKTAQGNTVIIDNTSTTIATGVAGGQQQVIKVGSSADLPIHQQG
jgi:hypothetical protein